MGNKEIKELKEKILKLEHENSQFKVIVQKFEERISILESGEKNTGVYLDGAPDYVKDYIEKTKEEDKKVGE